MRRTGEGYKKERGGREDARRGRPKVFSIGYTEIANALAPRDLDPSTLMKADQTLWGVAERVGQPKLQEIITRGQYNHPDGLYFGGTHRPGVRTRFAQSSALSCPTQPECS